MPWLNFNRLELDGKLDKVTVNDSGSAKVYAVDADGAQVMRLIENTASGSDMALMNRLGVRRMIDAQTSGLPAEAVEDITEAVSFRDSAWGDELTGVSAVRVLMRTSSSNGVAKATFDFIGLHCPWGTESVCALIDESVAVPPGLCAPGALQLAQVFDGSVVSAASISLSSWNGSPDNGNGINFDVVIEEGTMEGETHWDADFSFSLTYTGAA